MNPDGTINESKVEFVSSNLRNQLRMKTSAPPPPPPNPIFNNNLGNYPNQVVSNTVAAASYVSTGWDPMSNGMDNPALNNYTYNNAVAPVVKSASFFNDSNKVDIGTGKKGFQTPKNLHPCRFFNTAKGCQNGDKCGFGHFRPDALIAMSGSSIDGIGGLQMDTRGDGVGLKRSRPGTAPPPPRMQGPGARTMMGKNRQLSAVLSNPIEFDHISSTKRTRNN